MTVSKSAAVEILKNRVLTMEIAPGALIDEVELATEFGLSRTPLREIIQRLSGEGYFTLEANRGAKAASMDFPTLRHFFQAAPMIYASVSRLAAENSNRADVGTLKDVQMRFRQSLEAGSVAEIAMANHRFHEAIGQIAGSAYLLPSLYRLLIDHTRIGQVFYKSKTPEDEARIQTASAQHEEMIEAIAAHNAPRAVELTLAHWELSRDKLEAFVQPDPLPFGLDDNAHAI